MPEHDLLIDRSILRHPLFIARLAEYRGTIVEDRLFAASAIGTTAVPHWPLLAIVFAGSGVMRHERGSVLMFERDLLLVPNGSSFSARSNARGTRVWILQWDPIAFGGAGAASATQHRLAPSDFGHLRGALERTVAARYAASECAAGLAQAFATLHTLGLFDATPSATELVVPLPASLVRVGIAIDGALSNLNRSPAAVDLERSLACSPAQLRRLIHRHGAAALGATANHADTATMPPPTWRDLLNGWRLAIGTLLMTSPLSRTERVAEQLGYSSPTSFCHAFANAKLPSPGNVRRAVDALA